MYGRSAKLRSLGTIFWSQENKPTHLSSEVFEHFHTYPRPCSSTSVAIALLDGFRVARVGMYPCVGSLNTLLEKISSERDLEKATPAYTATPRQESASRSPTRVRSNSRPLII